MIRVVIAIDHAIVRWALREALATQPGLTFAGEASTVDETLEVVRRTMPDVLIVDPDLPDHKRLDVLTELRQLESGPLVVVLSPHREMSYVARALAAGAHSYLNTSASAEELFDAVQAVARGERVIPPRAASIAAGDRDALGALTRREVQVMEMIGRGMTNREIAADLGISIKTVDTHRSHTLRKLGLRNNSELTRFAVRHGYAPL